MHFRRVGLLSRHTLMRLILLRIEGQPELVSVKKKRGQPSLFKASTAFIKDASDKLFF
jgi:hypothetical protein